LQNRIACTQMKAHLIAFSYPVFQIYRQIRLLNAVKLVTALDLFGRHGAHPLDA
jgi:hypothetical protein